MNLSTTLTVVLVTVVVATTASVGLLIDSNLESAVLPAQLEVLHANTEQSAHTFEASLSAAREDVLALAAAPAVRELSEGTFDGASHIAELFLGQLHAKSNYLQLRILDSEGRERVRVQRRRAGRPVEVVPDSELQSKAASLYFREAVTVPVGDVHVSRLELNVEHGSVVSPYIPVVRVATPLPRVGSGGRAGVLVLNVTMGPALRTLRHSTVPHGSMYLVNQNGDFLLHPNPAMEFGFSLGHPVRLETEDPDLVTATDGVHTLGGRGVAAVPLTPGDGPALTLIQTVPLDVLAAASGAIRRSTLISATLLTLIALVVATLLARRLVRPITDLTGAADALRRGEAPKVPLDSPGEIGVLARTFDQMAQEIRQQAQALSEQLEISRLYNAIVESSEDAMLTLSPDGLITGWNPAAERTYGYSREEAIGQPVDLVVPEELRDEAHELLDQVKAGARIEHFETVRMRKSGRRIRVSLSVSPLKDAGGTITGAAKIARDITAQREAERMFGLAVEASPSGMLLTDADGRIVFANLRTEALFGFTRAEIIGEPIARLFPQDLPASFEEVKGGESSGEPSATQVTGRRKTGASFPAEVTLSPTVTESGVLVLWAVADISERLRVAGELAQQRANLERSNAELQQFAYVASHDLQEPLRMVASFTGLLADRYADRLDERGLTYVRYAVEGAKRMQQLVKDLLAISQLDRRSPQPTIVDTEKLVAEVTSSLSTAIMDADARVEHDALPLVVADRSQLGQVFQNLIGNAVKFRGDAPPRIRITATTRDGRVELAVADNGIGIEPEYTARIFRMFQRLHDRSEYEGNGIGLAVCKKIVEAHGGRIWVESDPGHGSTFYFTVPAAGEGDA